MKKANLTLFLDRQFLAMSIFLQLFTIVGMVFVTYSVFQAFGAPRKNLLYSKQEKEEWDSLVGQSIGSWFTITNVVGTLTSLATVYVFFIGSSKLFGWWVFLCSITIWGSSFVTNYFTKKICSSGYVAELLKSGEQVGGVISSVFWRPDEQSKRVAKIVKWISLINIGSVIWLEFALFADISGLLLNQSALTWRILLLAFCCFTVTFFTLRYGLRGFVFADIFQSPLIALSALTLIVGCIILFLRTPGVQITSDEFFRPILPLKDCFLFAFQVISLNSLLVLVTESHWLRVWIFRRKETELLVKSTGTTALLWFVMANIGLFATQICSGNPAEPPVVGENAIVGLLTKLNGISAIFLVAFWTGGMAALFSTADAQIYSFLLVKEFDSESGKLKTVLMSTLNPLRTSIIVTISFAAVYTLVRYLSLPFEKMIFLVLPICLNIFPAFVLAAIGAPQRSAYILLSLVLYVACSIAAILQPREQFSWTLAAPVMPILVGGLAWLLNRRNAGGSQPSGNGEAES